MAYEERKLSTVIENFVPGHSPPMTPSQLRRARYLDIESRLATRGALIALTLVAFLLRAPYLDAQSLWRDEVDVIRLADELLPQFAQKLLQIKHNGPLYYLLIRDWLGMAGDSEFALRYLPLCFGVLAVPLVYWAGRRLVGERAARLTAALVAISPYLVWYSQDAKMYSLVTALTLLALACQLEAMAKGQARWWAGFVISASLSLYAHLLSALMIPVYTGMYLLAWPRSRGRRWWGLVSLGFLTVPYLPLATWQLPLVLETYDTGHPFYPLRQMISLLFNLYSRGVAMVGGWLVVAAFVFAMLGGLFSSAEKGFWGRPESNDSWTPGRIRKRLVLLGWLFFPIVLVYLISLRAPVFEPRYLIFVAPAFYLLTASGVMALARISRAAAGLALALILSFSLLSVWVQAITPIKSDFRAAAEYVMARRQKSTPIMFQMPYVRHTFDYYFEGDYIALEGPWTNQGIAETQVEGVMAGLLEDYPEVWLVASESRLWDSRGLTQTWLDQNGRLIESASFALVDVYHYGLSNLE